MLQKKLFTWPTSWCNKKERNGNGFWQDILVHPFAVGDNTYRYASSLHFTWKWDDSDLLLNWAILILTSSPSLTSPSTATLLCIFYSIFHVAFNETSLSWIFRLTLVSQNILLFVIEFPLFFLLLLLSWNRFKLQLFIKLMICSFLSRHNTQITWISRDFIVSLFWNTCERNKTSSNYMQNTRSLLNPFQNSFNYNVFLFTLKTQDTSTDIQIQYWSYKTLLFFLNDANRGEYFIMNHDTCSSSTLPIKQ